MKLFFNGRTHPIGAQVIGAFGLGYPVWGDPQTWKYGYVRAGLNLMTSAVVNRAGIELQVFPISIVGFTAGYDTGVRNFVPQWLSCNIYECTGRVDRKYVRMNLMAAVKRISVATVFRYEEMRGFGSAKPLFDEVSLLVGNKNGENVFTFSPAVLYRVTEQTQVGFASLYSHAVDTGGYSHLYGPIVSYTPEPKFNAMVGLGLNTSPVVHSGFCGFFVFQYNIVPSLSVMDLRLRKPNPDASESLSQ